MAKKIKRRVKAIQWAEFLRGRQGYADGVVWNDWNAEERKRDV